MEGAALTGARVPVGMIHGRFQPFHNGHLDYLRRSVERCRSLVEAADTRRSPADANPSPVLGPAAHPRPRPLETA